MAKRRLVFPFLAPYLFAAMRYGFSVAWKIATLVELFGSSEGIGFVMRREFQLFNMTGLLAWIFFFFAFALLLEKVVLQRAEKHFSVASEDGALTMATLARPMPGDATERIRACCGPRFTRFASVLVFSSCGSC